MIRRRLPRTAILLLMGAVAGCAPGVGLVAEDALEVEPGAETLLFAPLTECYEPGATPEVVVARPERGQVDLVAERKARRWSLIGSFYSGRFPPEQVIVADVGARPVVLARSGRREVTLLSGDLSRPHHLRPPVRVFPPGDQERDDVRVIAAGDLDDDGSDELVVVAGGRIMWVDALERALYADPEKPPELPTREVEGGHDATDVAVIDATGNGLPDVVSLHDDGPRVRIHDTPGLDRERPRDYWDIDLPAEGTQLLATRCQRGEGAVVLDDGTVARLRWGDDPSVVDGLRNIVLAAGRDDAVAFVDDQGAVLLRNGCLRGEGRSNAAEGADVQAISLARRTGGKRRFGTLGADGASVRIFRVTGGL